MTLQMAQKAKICIDHQALGGVSSVEAQACLKRVVSRSHCPRCRPLGSAVRSSSATDEKAHCVYDHSKKRNMWYQVLPKLTAARMLKTETAVRRRACSAGDRPAVASQRTRMTAMQKLVSRMAVAM